MSLKRVLGVMLASRMAGRGGRGRGLGSAAMLGGLARGGRGGIGRKAGLASLAYLAYRHYQDRDRQPSSASDSAASGSGGGIGGMIGGVLDSIAGGRSPGPEAAGQAQPGAAEDRARGIDEDPSRGIDGDPSRGIDGDPSRGIDEDRALLLIRAMIAAAHADGEFSADERARIMQTLDEGGADAADRARVESEIAHPRPLQDLLSEVRDPETAQQVYLASRAAIDPETEANRAYLANLRRRLDLSDEDVAAAEELAVA